MSQSRRAQVLLEPKEYEQLEVIARQERVSVSGLIRAAVRGRYFPPGPDRGAIVEELLTLALPVSEDWRDLNQAIEEAQLLDLP